VPCSQSVCICVHERVSVCLTVNRIIKKSFRRESRNSYYGSRAYMRGRKEAILAFDSDLDPSGF